MAFYTDHDVLRYKNVNRIVYVDLDNFVNGISEEVTLDSSITLTSDKKDLLQIRLTNLYFLDTLVDDALTIHVDHIEAQYQEEGKTQIYTLQLKPDPKDSASYIGTIDLSGFDQTKGEIKINIYTEDGTVLENIVSGSFSY